MNYFAHAVRFLDRPDFLAGLAVPDWLSVVDRSVRVRRRNILERLPVLPADDLEIALGILQHLDDDQWFHTTAAFFETTGLIARDFRRTLPEDDTWRCGFLGHVTLELLVDATLIEDDPAALTRYYDVLADVDGQHVQRVVAELAGGNPPRLPEFIELYRRERFLEDYLDDRRLLIRMNQVMHRVGLQPLPADVADVLNHGRRTVRSRLSDLLPAERFAIPGGKNPQSSCGHPAT